LNNGDGTAECSFLKDPTCCGGEDGYKAHHTAADADGLEYVPDDDQCKMLGLDLGDVLPGTVRPDLTGLLSEADASVIECEPATDCTTAAYCIKEPTFQGMCPSRALKGVKEDSDRTASGTGGEIPPAWYDSLLWQPQGTQCDSREKEGEDKVYLSTCNSKGECQGSICAAFKSSYLPVPSFAPVPCELDEAPCQVHCKFEEDGECVPLSNLVNIDVSGYLADIGNGTSQKNSLGESFPTVITKVVGQPCKSYRGTCDSKGACFISSELSPEDYLLAMAEKFPSCTVHSCFEQPIQRGGKGDRVHG
jgi:hypothetical protein